MAKAATFERGGQAEEGGAEKGPACCERKMAEMDKLPADRQEQLRCELQDEPQQ